MCKATRIEYNYRPQRSCGQGNIFTPVCHSVHGGFCLSACWDTTPRTRHPPEQSTPLEQTPPDQTPCPPWSRHPGSRHPPWSRPPRSRSPTEQTPWEQIPPPPREADSSIRSTSGRYASYWNAFLVIYYVSSSKDGFILSNPANKNIKSINCYWSVPSMSIFWPYLVRSVFQNCNVAHALMWLGKDIIPIFRPAFRPPFNVPFIPSSLSLLLLLESSLRFFVALLSFFPAFRPADKPAFIKPPTTSPSNLPPLHLHIPKLTAQRCL